MAAKLPAMFLKQSKQQLLALALIFLLQGCAPKSWEPQELEQRPAEIWQELQLKQNQKAQSRGYRVRASVHYISPQKSSRFTFSLWGNYDLPLRLDLRAGIGTSFSYWRIAQDQTLAYYPRQGQVFIYTNQKQGLAHLDLEMPFSVQEIGEILTNNWQGLLPRRYAQARTIQGQGWQFEFQQGHRLRSITVDPNLRIVRVQGDNPLNWKLELKNFQDIEDLGVFAHSLDLDLGRKEQALFRIQDLQLRQDHWPDSALELEPPENTKYIPMAF